MKGLRHELNHRINFHYFFKFLPCDLNEGITTNIKKYNIIYINIVFTLWPEWRDYDDTASPELSGNNTCFYLVTWMKGLRPDMVSLKPFCNNIGFYLVTWMKGLRRTNSTSYRRVGSGFYLVTWMKGLRHRQTARLPTLQDLRFYLVTWMKGLRLMDCRASFGSPRLVFLPCDLNEGITTPNTRRIWRVLSPRFYLVTWMKGLRPFYKLPQ